MNAIKYKSRFILLILILAVCPGCRAESPELNPSTKDLPDKRPGNFSITYHDGGGMTPISEHLYISKDSCFYKKNRYGNEVKLNFNLSVKELDDIYDILKKYRFDEIETFQKKVYDRGGEFVSINFDNESITRSNAGMNFIQENWREEFEAISKMLTSIAEKIWKQNSREFTIKVMKGIKDSKGYIIFDESQVYKSDKEFDFDKKLNESGFYELKLNLIDGVYSMNYFFNNKYQKKSIDIKGFSSMIIDEKDGELVFDLN